ncbi:hypothetical protein [Natronospira bacteriovora]|uniref:Uncharacterized protein n=1 Tax=Natronospira bacteriovora TaxID=3069753 RepID=A0ABU0W3V9_9GAMM|nr:hypothetical protein [Natronospira sp. AB-CW4]MDQ2068646.1 hypothetical protein [Natronospira sp. AB-CW4]
MAIELFPRLTGFAAQQLWEQLQEYGNEGQRLPEYEGAHHEAVTWTATGGRRVETARLEGIRQQILDLASQNGFPGPAGDRQKTRFDAACARYLAEEARIPFPEACRREIWSYFCIILLPDVTAWRFSLGARERWVGGMRNTFETLWRRGYLIGLPHGDGPPGWEYVDRLTQDAFVQILDRTGLSAEPQVARLLAETWVELADEFGQGRMEEITREALKSLLAYRRVVNFDVLPARELEQTFKEVFLVAARQAAA